MSIISINFGSLFRGQRFFVFSLVVVIGCFASALVSTIVPGRVAELGRWAGLIASLLAGLSIRKSQGGNVSKAGVDKIVWVLLLAFFLSASFSVAVVKSLLYFLVCLLQILVFVFLSRRLSAPSWRFLFQSLMVLCIFISWASLVGYVSSPDQYIVQGRLAGLSNANAVGVITMIGFVIAFTKIFVVSDGKIVRWKLQSFFYLTAATSCLYALYLSGSRSSLAGALLGVIIALFFARRSAIIKLLILVFCSLLPLLYSVADDRLLHYQRDDSNDLLFSRQDVWFQSLELFRENLLLGTGYAAHDEAGTIIDGSGYHGLLASVGIIGTSLFLAIALAIIFRLVRRGLYLASHKNYAYGHRDIIALGAGCFVALLTQGVGEPWMIGPGSLMHVIYWLSVGACLSSLSAKPSAVQCSGSVPLLRS